MSKFLSKLLMFPVLLLMRMAVGLMAGVCFMLIVIRWLKK